MQTQRKGFTLIELLVVIAIIAILAAILFPVFAKARERAMLSTCINNNKQLGVAFMLYTDDSGGKLPFWELPGVAPSDAQFRAVNANNTTWDVALYPYVKTKDSYTCPSSKAQGAKTKKIRSYSLPRNVSGMPLSYAKSPSKTVLLMEKGSQVLGVGADAPAELFGQTVDGALAPISQYPNDPKKWGFPHDDGKVFLFLDGHAKWYKGMFDVSTENPFGYYFTNARIPPPVPPRQFLGFCGDSVLDASAPGGRRGSFGTGAANPNDHAWGANLPE